MSEEIIHNERRSHDFFEGKVLSDLEAIKASLISMKSDNVALEGRVRVLEQWKFWMAGASFIAGSIGAFIVSLITK